MPIQDAATAMTVPPSSSLLSPGLLPPGSTIGILGGGQLGRMTALAAARLGYRAHVFCPEADSPAAQVAAAATVAGWDDNAALDRFAGAVDVVTSEFENVPMPAAARLAAAGVPVRPSPRVLGIAQDRLAEKAAVTALDIPTAPHVAVDAAAGLAAAVARIGRPAVLKSNRLGYDGKGQTRIGPDTDLAAAWAVVAGHAGADAGAILEGEVAFDREISVIAARGIDGRLATYVPVENRHADHILATTTAPAPIAPDTAALADRIARRLATGLEVVGLLAVEMFVTADGGLLVNELAPRPHNSGHWTMDACTVSQFEQLVRAICGLPLGDPARHADAVMTNLIGDAATEWATLLAEPGACLHLYGKAAARAGRKMGHVNRLLPRS